MKYILAFLLPVFISSANGQTLSIDSATGKYTYAGIVKFEKKTKPVIFDYTKKWLIGKPMSVTTSIIKIDDKKNGLIVCFGAFENLAGISKKIFVSFQLFIEIKDGVLKYTFTDFLVSLPESQYKFEGVYDVLTQYNIIEATDINLKLAVIELKLIFA